MMIGVSISILLLWVIPWGILVIIPLILGLSFASPAAREEWSKFKNRRIAIGIILLIMLNSLGFYPASEPSAPEEWGKPLFTKIQMLQHGLLVNSTPGFTIAVIGVVNIRTHILFLLSLRIHRVFH